MINKIRRFFGKGIDKPLTAFDWFIFFVLAVLCYFSFEHGDILHTGGSSFAYLNGHILDFYEFNKQAMGGNNYLPSSYILFAIWNIPLKLFGIVTVPTFSVSGFALFWYKALPTLFYLVTTFVIYKIGLIIGLGNKKSKLCAYAWLTTPIAFFSQFIFGQYDIFTIFFMLLGIYFYYKNDMFKFVLFFAISLTFKYFPIFIFIPLLMLKEKNIWKIIKNCIFVMIPIAIEVGVYFTSPAFRKGVFEFGATTYILGPSITAGYFSIKIFIVAWILICGLAYFKDTDNKNDLVKWGLYYSNLVIFLIFGLSLWHPQWVIFAVPFWVLSTFISKKFNVFIILDILMMLFFIMVIINFFTGNVDHTLMYLGVYKNFTSQIYLLPMNKLFILKDKEILFSLFSSIVLLNAVFKHPKFCLDDFSESIDKHWILVRTRFFVGVSIFVIPAFICLIGSHFMPTPSLSTGFQGAQMTQTFTSDKNESQVFTAKTETISKIDIKIGTGNRVNNCGIEVNLCDFETKKVLYTTNIDVPKLKDNEICEIKLPKIKVEKYKKYIVNFKASRTTQTDNVMLYITGNDQDANDSYALINGEKQSYDLFMNITGK